MKTENIIGVVRGQITDNGPWTTIVQCKDSALEMSHEDLATNISCMIDMYLNKKLKQGKFNKEQAQADILKLLTDNMDVEDARSGWGIELPPRE